MVLDTPVSDVAVTTSRRMWLWKHSGFGGLKLVLGLSAELCFSWPSVMM